MYNSLAPQTMFVEPEPKLQAPAPPSKCFGSAPKLLHLRLCSPGLKWGLKTMIISGWVQIRIVWFQRFVCEGPHFTPLPGYFAASQLSLFRHSPDLFQGVCSNGPPRFPLAPIHDQEREWPDMLCRVLLLPWRRVRWRWRKPSVTSGMNAMTTRFAKLLPGKFPRLGRSTPDVAGSGGRASPHRFSLLTSPSIVCCKLWRRCSIEAAKIENVADTQRSVKDSVSTEMYEKNVRGSFKC